MSSDTKTKVEAMLIIEALGKPKEHLVETLKKIVENIKSEKDVKINEYRIAEPNLVKNQKDLYSTFVEVEVEVEESIILSRLLFTYMPSHVEILSPEEIKISNNDLGDIFAEMVRKLHQYDELARVLQLREKRMLDKMKELEKKE